MKSWVIRCLNMELISDISETLLVHVMSVTATCIYTHKACCQLSQHRSLREPWLEAVGQWCDVLAWTIRGRRLFIISHAPCRWSSITKFFNVPSYWIMLMARYHKQLSMNPMSLLRLSGCSRISVPPPLCGPCGLSFGQYSSVLADYRVLECSASVLCFTTSGLSLSETSDTKLHIHTTYPLRRLYCIQFLWKFSIILLAFIVSHRVICDVFERMQQFSPEFAAADCSGIPMFQRWSWLSRSQRWDTVLLSPCVLTVSLTHVLLTDQRTTP